MIRIIILALFAVAGSSFAQPIPTLGHLARFGADTSSRDSSWRMKNLVVENLTAANISIADTTPGLRDTVLKMAEDGELESLWVSGPIRGDSNATIRGILFGRMPQSAPGAESERSMVAGRKAGELGVYSPLNIYLGDLTGRGDTIDPVTYPNNSNDNVCVSIWGMTKVTGAVDNTCIGNFTLEDCRDCQRLVAVGWRNQRHAVSSSETVSAGAQALMKNRNGSGNVVIADAGLRECDSCALNDASGFRTGMFWQNSHHNLTKGAWAGFYYGYNLDTLTKTDRGIFMGSFAAPLRDSSFNEVAIGYGSVGFGNHSFTIGNSDHLITVPGRYGSAFGDTARPWGTGYFDATRYRRALVGWDTTNGLLIRGTDSGLVNALSIFSSGGAYLIENPRGENSLWLNRETGNTFIGQKLSIGTGSVSAGYKLIVAGGGTMFSAATTTYPSFLIPNGEAPTVPPLGGVWMEGGVIYYFDGADVKSLDATVVAP